MDILRTHIPDKRPSKEKPKDKNKKKSGGTPTDTAPATGTESSFVQSGSSGTDIYCYICGKKGHINADCPKKNTPRSQWVAQRLLSQQQHTQQTLPEDQVSDDDHSVNSTTSLNTQRSVGTQRSSSGGARSRRSGTTSAEEHWSGWQQQHVQFQSFQFLTHQEETEFPDVDLDNDLLIDSGSTIEATIKNPDLVSNVKASSKPITMATNGGTKVLNLEAEMPGVSKAYLDTSVMANILGLTHITDKYRVTMDSAVEDAIIVHSPNGNLAKFTRKKQRLYSYTVPESVKELVCAKKGTSDEIDLSGATIDGIVHLIDSVAENSKGFTQ
jgi:hypothetical protein